jgi:hypothetical protein
VRQLEHQRAASDKLAATGRMAARVAHEINNPLAGIKNSLLLVKDAIPGDHPHFQYVELIEAEIRRIAEIVRRMYDLYHPETAEPVPVPLAATARNVLALLQSTFKAAGVSVKLELPDRPVESMMVRGSPNQILYNLMQNAVEASGPGDTVTVSVVSQGSRATIQVADEGTGIAEELQERVFEPFFTSKSGGEASGLGLGLTVTKGLVEAAGGGITFESEPGRTVFRVELPLRMEHEES